jgi:hypothetical protein
MLLSLGHPLRYLVGAVLSLLVFPVEGLVVSAVAAIGIAIRVHDLWSAIWLTGYVFLWTVPLWGAFGLVATALVAVPAVGFGELAARRGRWWLSPFVAAAVGLALTVALTLVLGPRFGLPAADMGWIVPLFALLVAPAVGIFTAVTHGSGAVLSWLSRRLAS